MKVLLVFLLLQVSQHALCVLKVEEGQEVVLPCQIRQVDLESTVEWTCNSCNPQFVFVWRQGSELTDTQNPRYRGRVKLQDDFLTTGKLDLILNHAGLCDSSSYTCSLRKAGQVQQETVQLQVTEKPSGLTPISPGEIAGIVIGVIAALISGLFIGFVIGRRSK